MAGEVQVWGPLFANWIKQCRALGANVDAAMRDVDFPDRDFSAMGTRLAWDDMVRLVDRILEREGEDLVIRTGEQHTVTIPAFTAVARAVVRPELAYMILMQGGRWLWPVEGRDRVVGNTLVVDCILPAHLRPCRGFLLTTVGLIRSFPQLYGLPQGDVTYEVTPSRGRYRMPIQQPASVADVAPSAFSALVESLRSVTGDVAAGHIVGVLVDVMTTSLGSGPTVLDLQRRLGLTRAEARVATRLAEGRTVERVAADLRVSPETVRTHLKSAFAKTGTHRQAELVALVLGARAAH